jgi:hypothetical protein
MGSKNSGRWLGSGKKTSVEQCLRLTVSNFRDSGIISGKADDVVYSWKTGEAEQDKATVRVRVASLSSTRIVACLAYTVHLEGKSHEINETIHLTKAARSNGANWWFQCPAQVDGVGCSRKVAILYLPPGEQFFACKHCHDLAYPWGKKNEETKGDEMDEMEDIPLDDETPDSWNPPGQSGQTADEAGGGEGNSGPSPQPLFFYIDHTLKLLDPKNTTITDKGRLKMVDELLSKMIREDGLSEERFMRAICDVQSLAPKALSAYAGKALREGSFSVGSKDLLAYFPLHRLGHILRMYLAEDLQATGAADLLLVDTAIAALVQTRILLSRATPLSPENGISIKEEKLLRSQAIAQQKIFLSAMDKLQRLKPARPLAKPPAKKTG